MVFVPIGSAHRARSSSLPRDEIGRGGGLASERDIYLYRANETSYLMECRSVGGAPHFGHGTWALNLTPRRLVAAPKSAAASAAKLRLESNRSRQKW